MEELYGHRKRIDRAQAETGRQMVSTQRRLTSVVSYPERGEGGNNHYRGNCSPKLVEALIRFFRPKEICDYMCGSGTTKAAAECCGIGSHIYDLHSGFDLLHNEIPERLEMIFWHPPYWDMVVYSDVMYKASDVQEKYGYDPRVSDLSRIPDWDGFVKAMNHAMLKQFSALEKGGRIAVLMGDIKKKGRLYSMLSEITKPGTMENILIKTQHNCVSDRTAYSGRFIPILHEYVLIVRKDEPLVVPVILSQRGGMDIRDMEDASWKDIVAAVLESCQKAVPLTYLYEQIRPYKRAQNSRWWKEKIRQTLQYHPSQFVRVEQGMWTLKKSAAGY